MKHEPQQLDIAAKLERSGIRPTRQRLALAELLFEQGYSHVSAEELHALARANHFTTSLATVYNTLKQFSAAGLLREAAAPGQTSYFCTNVSNHHHFYDEKEGTLIDIGECDLSIDGLPEAPHGKRVARIDVIVHLVDD